MMRLLLFMLLVAGLQSVKAWPKKQACISALSTSDAAATRTVTATLTPPLASIAAFVAGHNAEEDAPLTPCAAASDPARRTAVKIVTVSSSVFTTKSAPESTITETSTIYKIIRASQKATSTTSPTSSISVRCSFIPEKTTIATVMTQIITSKKSTSAVATLMKKVCITRLHHISTLSTSKIIAMPVTVPSTHTSTHFSTVLCPVEVKKNKWFFG